MGTVTDANTGRGVVGADVIRQGTSPDTATTPLAGGPPQLAGSYWMFSPATGSRRFQASAFQYVTGTGTADVTPDAAVRLDRTLNAGRLSATPDAVSVTQQLGGTASAAITVTNTGSAPVELKVGEESGGGTVPGQAAAATGTARQVCQTCRHASSTISWSPTRPSETSIPSDKAHRGISSTTPEPTAGPSYPRCQASNGSAAWRACL